MKKILFLVFIISFQAHAFTSKRWMEYSKNEDLNIKRLIELLSRSSTGEDLLLRAKKRAGKKGQTLMDVIKPGRSSMTDTTLTRRFSMRNPGAISYILDSKIFIDKELTTYDAILDLAHELTHYTYRKEFNPYKRNFSLEGFMHSTVEGTGGEVDAYIMECKILKELYSSKVSQRYSCKEIIDPQTGYVSRQLAVNKFYRIGTFYKNLKKKLRKHELTDKFPDLQEKEPIFISSAYGVPYPVAAYHEYVNVLNKVCENDKNRLAVMKSSATRSPASSNVKKRLLSFRKNYHARCHDVDKYEVSF
jgi:hypothetical protein